jgi:putative ABC transport system permease protein
VVPGGRGEHTTGAYVLNELAARELGWTPDEAIGKWFETDFSFDFSTSVRGPIVGVVRNTYIESLREPLKPLAYFASAPTYAYATLGFFSDASVRITGKRLPETLAYIDAVWREVEPDLPLARVFLGDQFAALYADEDRQMQVFGVFAALAIGVACLGLFGLASFTTERRTKEIGIRKTLGGSVVDVVGLLTSEFSRLVLLANVVAWPVAYLVMRRWLADFAYRIDFSPLIFVGCALVAFAIAWLTVAGIALRAASAKPLHSLRYE